MLAWPSTVHFDLMAVGGASKFTNLIKLVAASEDAFGKSSRKINSGGKKTYILICISLAILPSYGFIFKKKYR